MDSQKLSNRIINGAKKSLKFQKLHNRIVPITLTEHREGKYFLVQCKINDRKKSVLFIRTDKWLFYIQGMTALPPEIDRREYDNSNRINEEKKVEERKKQKQKITKSNGIERSLELAIKEQQ